LHLNSVIDFRHYLLRAFARSFMYMTIASSMPSGASSKSVGDKPVSTETAAIE
jgi:hypothetical protein